MGGPDLDMDHGKLGMSGPDRNGIINVSRQNVQARCDGSTQAGCAGARQGPHAPDQFNVRSQGAGNGP